MLDLGKPKCKTNVRQLRQTEVREEKTMGASKSETIIKEKLGAWLLQEDKTQGHLAKELGITRQTLTERLRGRTQWKWSEVIEISRVTDTPLDVLAGLR